MDHVAAHGTPAHVTDARDRRAYRATKRVLDVTLSVVLLVVLMPLLAIVAFAIKLTSPGPIILRQRRVGYLGRQFNLLKFRTMVPDRRRNRRGSSPRQGERRRRHKVRRDPRVTRLGRLLRRTSFDEIPQLWNVIRGEMSLVGPRPELSEIVARYEAWQHARHAVVPGITGWWQINRDDRTLMCQVTELDLYYVRHRSLGLDVLILLRMVGALWRGTGAY